jgi:DNA-binding winged helix-turn-helix (wHTH) protein
MSLQTHTMQSELKLAQLQAEKCDLEGAYETYLSTFNRSKVNQMNSEAMEALAGLLRLSSEALDAKGIAHWSQELDHWMERQPSAVPPLVWYCKGAIARYQNDWLLAQRHFHRYLRCCKLKLKTAQQNQSLSSEWEQHLAKGWMMLATVAAQRGLSKRSEWLCHEILNRFEHLEYRGINGITYILLGTLSERKKDYTTALLWFQKAHASLLGEHNWFYHLYALFGYARVARAQKNIALAGWYIELLQKATAGPQFALLRREIEAEKSRLQEESVDLLIDSQKGIIYTPEKGKQNIGKQFILLQLLEVLAESHLSKTNKGLSKGELIKKVWKEDYQPTLHDNKLYYNVNRLRRLIEANPKKPQLILNWKKGYRLAPHLQIHQVKDMKASDSKKTLLTEKNVKPEAPNKPRAAHRLTISSLAVLILLSLGVTTSGNFHLTTTEATYERRELPVLAQGGSGHDVPTPFDLKPNSPKKASPQQKTTHQQIQPQQAPPAHRDQDLEGNSFKLLYPFFQA